MTMNGTTILKFEAIDPIDRGSGIRTWPLIVNRRAPNARFTTGMSSYPVGEGAPMHCHNCDEQVTLLEGVGEVEVDGVRHNLKKLFMIARPATIYGGTAEIQRNILAKSFLHLPSQA